MQSGVGLLHASEQKNNTQTRNKGLGYGFMSKSASLYNTLAKWAFFFCLEFPNASVQITELQIPRRFGSSFV